MANLKPMVSRKMRLPFQKKRRPPKQPDPVKQLIAVWERRAKPKLRTQIEGSENPGEKKTLLAFLNVVTTVLITEAILDAVPEEKPSLKTEPTVTKVQTSA